MSKLASYIPAFLLAAFGGLTVFMSGSVILDLSLSRNGHLRYYSAF